MKKLFVIVLAAIGMVSCMNTDEVIEVNNDNAIAFADAFIENSVRAEINNDNLTQFNVWGWMQEDAVEAPVFNAMEVTLSGADWTYSPAQYWVPGFTYTFKALSSNGGNGWVAAETTDGKLGEVTFTNVDGTEDLIYAAPAAVAAPALGTTAQPVELEFNHQLAKVKFDFEYAPELVAALNLSGLTVKAEEITMKVPGKATIDYSATTPAWILDTTAAQTTLAFAEEGVEKLTIPAGAAYEYVITFKVKYYQGANVIKTIDKTSKISLAIEMGKAYNFTATLTPDNLGLTTIDFETKVEGWDDAGAGFEPEKKINYVSNNEELKAAFEAGADKIILLNDIVLTEGATRATADATLTINNKLTIDLGGHTLSTVSNNTGKNYDMFNVTGANANLTVQNGTIAYEHKGDNMGWNSSTSIFNITAGGVVTLNGITAKNLGGSDMAFVAHLNNWGEATLNVENSTLESTYIAVRAFNSGHDMNNITINNSTLKGKYCFWVHNYKEAGDSAGTDATLNLDILNATNTFECTPGKAPILYGFNNPVYYTVVKTADEFAAAIASDVVGVAVAADIEVAPAKIANGKTVIIDLGGNTLSAVDTTEEGYEMISNAGNLTIKGDGKMTVKATINSGWSRRSSVISNTVGGNLTVKGGVIEHLGGTDMAYGIDNLTNGKGTSAITTIEGGLIKSTYSAIRQFLNGTEATNELYVKEGAELYSPNRAVFFQDPSKNANTGKLVIEAGAKVTGKVYLSSTAGSTAWPVEVSVAASALTEGSVVAHSEVLPAGYAVVLENGVYTVVEAAAVTTAEELAAAVANKLETIYVSGEIDLANVILSGYNGTIVGLDNTAVLNTRNFIPSADECYQLRCEAINFKNITVKVPTEDGDFLKTGFVGFGEINFDNCVFEGQVTLNGQASWTFNNCEFASIETGAYAVFVYGAAKATFNNCSFSGVDRAAKIYGTGGVLDVEYNNCTFTSTTANKYAVNIDATYATTTVALNGCSQTGMPGLYKVDGTKGTVSVN